MPVLSPERVDEVVVGWRDFDDDHESPAGPLFIGGYTESEITMTGGFPVTLSDTCPREQLIDDCGSFC
jgi:hypothetical protein